MTRPSEVNKVTATGNGTRRTFSFSPMVIFANSQLSVVTRVTATGVETPRLLGTTSTTYSISIPANGYPATGSIDFPASGGTLLPSTEEIIISLNLPLKQGTNLERGPYDPEVQEREFDRLVALIQQQQEQLDRCLKVPIGTPATLDMKLPPPITGERYPRLNSGLTDWELVALASTGTAVASGATPQGVALLTAAAGTSDDYSRADHAHLVDAYIKFSADVHNALNFS